MTPATFGRAGRDPDDLPRAYYQGRVEAQLLNELVGLARGVLADGDVSEREVGALLDWLKANPAAQSHFPGRELTTRLLAIVADGIVSRTERDAIGEYLSALVGGGGTAQPGPTAAPLDRPPPDVAFNDALFAFTGTFAFGSREECCALTASLGGIVGSSVTRKTRYLVVGEIGSGAWVTSSFGRKIVKAVEYRDRGQRLSIIAEPHWLDQARRSPGAR